MEDYTNPNSLLIILGIVAIIIEIVIGAATGFELLILGIIFVIGGAMGMVMGSFTFAVGTIVVLTFAYIFFARNMIKKSLHITTHKTNADSIVGRTVQVVSDITGDDPGQIKTEGEIWRAEAGQEIKKGEKAVIQSISGVTVRVKKL